MDDVRFLVPLLDFPERALKYVLQEMKTIDQLSLSLCSNKSKDLVSSHHPNASFLRVTLHETAEIEAIFQDLPAFTCTLSDVPIPQQVKFTHGYHGVDRESTEMDNSKKFDLKAWIDHISTIFNCSKATLELKMVSEVDFYDAIEKLTITDIELDTNFSEGFVMKCLPRTDNLFINAKHPFNQKTIMKVLIQNFKKLHLLEHEINLIDLQLINSSHASVLTKFQEDELNRYLQLWKAGSNPSMKNLMMHIPIGRKLDQNLLFKGVEFKEASEENKMMFKMYRDQKRRNFDRKDIQFAGYEIRRDLERATILISMRPDSISFQMLIL